MRARSLMFLAAVLVGCVREDDAARCGPNADARGDTCVPKVDVCEGAQRAIPSGGCAPVGVPSDGCGAGFQHDGAGGCLAVLPKEACPSGRLALPGETSCRPVAECGDGPWGSIPITATTRFVDGGYTGGSSDGTRERPFTTIQRAIDLARANDDVAIAAGVYREDLIVRWPIRLWGSCPEKVSLEGIGTDTLDVVVELRVPSELHGLSIRGPKAGVAVLYTSGVTLLDRVWIHDTGERGMRIEGDPAAPSQVLVQRSLFERNAVSAVYVSGATLTMESSVIRDGIAHPTYGIGAGILAIAEPDNLTPATIAVKGSLIERMQTAGIGLVDSNGTVEDTLVRDVRSETDKPLEGAPALTVRRGDKAAVNPTLSLARVVVERSEGVGIYYNGADGTITHVTVRDVSPSRGDGQLGTGIQADGGSNLEVVGTSVRSFRYFGLATFGSTLSLRSSYVADGKGTSTGLGGVGLFAGSEGSTRASVTVLESLFARTRVAGVYVAGSDGRIEDSEVRDTLPQIATNTFGDGLASTAHGDPSLGTFQQADLVVRRAIVRRSARAAANVAAGKLALQDSQLTCSGFDLEVDRNYGGEAVTLTADFTLRDEGGNICGCGDAYAACRANSSSLAPLPAETK